MKRAILLCAVMLWGCDRELYALLVPVQADGRVDSNQTEWVSAVRIDAGASALYLPNVVRPEMWTSYWSVDSASIDAPSIATVERTEETYEDAAERRSSRVMATA